MNGRDLLQLFVAGLLVGSASVAHAEIPAHQAERISEAAPRQATAEPAEPRRVLIFVTPPHLMEDDPHAGYCIPFGSHALATLGEKTGAYEPVVSDDLAMFLPENIEQFDAIVLNNTSGAWIAPTADDMQRDAFAAHGESAEAVEQVLRDTFIDYVRQGGGVAATHYAIGANRDWPQFREMLGARYDGHPWNEEVGIRIDEPAHPVVAAQPAEGLRLADEIYQFAEPYSRRHVRVLMSLDPATTNMDVDWINREDDDFALTWVRSFGEGRVFYTALGHRTEIYWNPAVLQLYLDGIQFATGDLDAPAAPREDAEEVGFQTLFNGKNLTGWAGDQRYWSVRDGAITGSTVDAPELSHNEFLIWEGGRPGDFELRLDYKLVGGNSGIYFQAEKRTEGDPLVGPQADFSDNHRWTGVLMEWQKRDILAERGQRVRIDENGEKHVVGSVGDPDELLEAVHHRDWNDYTIITRDGHTVLKINDVVMCEVIDEDPARTPAGHLGLQVHVGEPMTVQFKNIRLKPLGDSGPESANTTQP